MANQPQQPDTALHTASHLMQYHDLIESIVAALDARDAYTASHSDRVADMVLVLAAALGLDEDETTRIHMAAHLHDIGKIAVPDSVLRKAGPLTRPEWEEMRRHPVTGYEILPVDRAAVLPQPLGAGTLRHDAKLQGVGSGLVGQAPQHIAADGSGPQNSNRLNFHRLHPPVSRHDPAG